MLPSGVDLPTGSISTPVGSFLRWLATVSRAGEPTVPDISTAKMIKEIKLPKFIGRRSTQRRIYSRSRQVTCKRLPARVRKGVFENLDHCGSDPRRDRSSDAQWKRIDQQELLSVGEVFVQL